MSQAPNLVSPAIDPDRIQALLSLGYVQEHFLRYVEGGDNYGWISVEDEQGREAELYVEFEPDLLRIAIENLTGPAPDNGFTDHRHFIFKLAAGSAGGCEILFQPVEVDEQGRDKLDTFPLADQPVAIQEAGLEWLSALESYLRTRDEELTQLKADLPPDMILNVLGSLDSLEELKDEFETLAASMGCDTYRLDEQFSELEHDDRMPRSYRICMDRTEPSMTEQDWEGIEQHTATAYFIVPRIYSERARLSISMATASCLAHLIDKRMITAAKIETAGLAHGLERWRTLVGEMVNAIGLQDRKTMLLALYKMFVRKPISHENKLYTCGMQHLGLPDFVIVLDEDEGGSEGAQWESVARFEAAFLTTFGVEGGGEVLKPYLGRPDFGYELGDIKHNPFGYTQVG